MVQFVFGGGLAAGAGLVVLVMAPLLEVAARVVA